MMRFSPKANYLHPILNPQKNDYNQNEFKLEVDPDKFPEKKEHYLEFKIKIEQDEIIELIEKGSVGLSVLLQCSSTSFMKSYKASLKEPTIIHFDLDDLHIKASIRAVLYATEEIENFSSDGLHPDFGQQSFNFKKSTLLGYSENEEFDVPSVKLDPPSIADLFEFELDKSLDEKIFEFDFEKDKVRILAGEKLHKEITKNNSNRSGKSLNMSSIYLYAMKEVFDVLIDDEDELEYKDKKWFQIMNQFFESTEDFSIDRSNTLTSAQTFLHFPYMQSSKTMEDLRNHEE